MLPPRATPDKKRKFQTNIPEYPWKKNTIDSERDHSIDFENLTLHVNKENEIQGNPLDYSIDLDRELETLQIEEYTDKHCIAIGKIQGAYKKHCSKQILSELKSNKESKKQQAIEKYNQFISNPTISLEIDMPKYNITSQRYLVKEKQRELDTIRQEIESLKKFYHVHCNKEQQDTLETYEVDLLQYSLDSITLQEVQPNIPIQQVKKRKQVELSKVTKKRKPIQFMNLIDKPPKPTKLEK